MDRREFLGLGLATAPFALGIAVPQAATHRRAGRLALVTADTEAHVVAVSLASGRVRARVRTLPGPRSIESARDGRAVIAHTTEGARTILDRGGLAIHAVVGGLGAPTSRAGARSRASAWALGRSGAASLAGPGRANAVGGAGHARGHIRPPFLAHDIGFSPAGGACG